MRNLIPSKLLRNAGIGVMASFISDTMVNSIRVVKTAKQAMGVKKNNLGYVETVRMIVAADGYKGLFGRGLSTRLVSNALQSLVFTVIWRGLADQWSSPQTSDDDSDEREDNDETVAETVTRSGTGSAAAAAAGVPAGVVAAAEEEALKEVH